MEGMERVYKERGRMGGREWKGVNGMGREKERKGELLPRAPLPHPHIPNHA